MTAESPEIANPPLSWLRSGVLAGALEGVLYAAWSLLLLWPVTLHLNDRTIGTGDAEYYAWLGWRIGELMKAGASPLFIPDVIYPEGYNLVLGDGLGAYLALGAVSAVTGPFLGLNLTVALTSFLNCLVGRRLARVAGTTDRMVWIVTALAFAGSPAIINRAAGHFHLCFAFVAGLVIAEAIRVARGEPLRVFVTGALLALAFYVSVYWLISSVVAFTVIVVVAAVRSRSLGATVGRAGAACLVGAVLTLPIVVPRLAFVSDERKAGGAVTAQTMENERTTIDSSADVFAIFVQPEGSIVPIPGAKALRDKFTGNLVESVIFPGLLLLLGMVGLLFVRSPLRMPVGAAFLTVWILSLGPILHIAGRTLSLSGDAPRRMLPAALFYKIPALESLRAPSRFGLTLSALAAVGLAVSTQAILRRARTERARILLVGVSGLLLVSGLKTTVWSSQELSKPLESAFELIRRSSSRGDGVIEVPFDADGKVGTARFQIEHRRPMWGFYGQSAAIPWFSDLDRYKRSEALAQLRCAPQIIAYAPVPFPEDLQPTGGELMSLRSLGVRYLVIDEVVLRTPVCARRRAEIEKIVASARVLARDGDWRVLEIVDEAS